MSKRFKLIFPKIARSFRRNVFMTEIKHTNEERCIKSIVRNLLFNPDSKVIYSPIKKSIRIQTRDKKHTLCISRNSISINHSRFSLRDMFGSYLLGECIKRIEEEIDIMDSSIDFDRGKFLHDVKNSTIKGMDEYVRKMEILEKSNPDKIEESIIEKILNK